VKKAVVYSFMYGTIQAQPDPLTDFRDEGNEVMVLVSPKNGKRFETIKVCVTKPSCFDDSPDTFTLTSVENRDSL
jgi:hypothetical protein